MYFIGGLCVILGGTNIRFRLDFYWVTLDTLVNLIQKKTQKSDQKVIQDYIKTY